MGSQYRGDMALRDPIGPEPAGVYWIRRGAVLAIVLTVLVAGWWLIAGRSESTPAATTAVESPSPEPSDPALAVPTECPDSSIVVTASTDAKSYRVGTRNPVLSLTITNVGPVACIRDVGPRVNELEIKSGGYHVWSSDDCNASKKSKVLTLQPNEPVQSSIEWNGRKSQKGCPNKGAKATAGTYEVIGRNGDVLSDGARFSLRKKN